MPVPPMQLQNDVKSLKIYHGAVKRLFKDVDYYEKEEVTLSAKLSQLQNTSGSCPSAVRRVEDILKETLKVIPDTKESLRCNLEKLCNIIRTKFSDMLTFGERQLEFCEPYIVNDGDTNLSELEEKYPGFTLIYEEVTAINETLLKVFNKFRNATLPNCSQFSGEAYFNPVVVPREEHVDI